ncbi:NUDIX hydrolase [Sulfuriflexus sp.]|uniref:NUDIX hydrolase n=1 Tax=Sulfuriflexus sp. TaxID=2015443 RepID=UPI0028CFA84F|nr:NUDIX hydrolase [Sulfuriflexus sp.]MDT8405586.1 NUDIX hydrolase [Sulfuriflexus sp.]
MPAPKTPLLTVDIIIEMVDRGRRPIVLIERRHPPPGWALPGGFVDIGESLEQAARREAREETCLEVKLTRLLGCYSNPARDPRGHTVSVVYIGEARGTPRAEDDARALKLYNHDQLPEKMAFDHADILTDYQRLRDEGIVPALQ